MRRGFGLIELLIVVALIGMLAAIAYPSYSDSLRRAARSEAVGLLHDAALRLQQHHARAGEYTDNEQWVTDLPAGNRHYRLDARRDSDGYTLRAMRLPQAAMAQDRCGDYQLEHTGGRSNAGAAGDAAGCWGD
ncbi:type IV pilin protein [Pantoea sp. Cy-639]|uniref:type IV pilin protein n=1 Tax=Pantoea sp. Cy-639 TaxID=2608360 RepID=UPI001420F201|nr:type IV pilin protein [Pantoea sp. Cy-639]NIF19958.1 prepilin-type N-terminal cleavage/methylation domain-containing protein [Pantoea sp. Cy-639]